MANGTTKITRTFGTPTDRDKWTLSAWVKLDVVQEQGLFWGWNDASNYTNIDFNTSAQLTLYNHASGSAAGQLRTNRAFRDFSAWYHIVVVWDSGNATAGDRIIFYTNGVRETSFSVENNPAQDTNSTINGSYLHELGAKYGSYDISGCMSYVQFVDGSALAPTEFGEFDSTSGIWKIKTGAYATPGNNGFFLKMEDRTNLDLDSSSNAHTFSTTGTLTPTVDNPSNNFCTFNSLQRSDTSSMPTMANGNTTGIFTSTAGWRSVPGTMAMNKGKWYYEAIGGATAGHNYNGISSPEWLTYLNPSSYGPSAQIGTGLSQPCYALRTSTGDMQYSNTSGNNNQTPYGNTGDNTTYWGVFFDLDNWKLYYTKNGVIENSGTGFDIESDFYYTPICGFYGTAAAGTTLNFGNGVFYSTALTGTTYSDDDGIGIFKYSPNYGGAATFDGSAKNFYAICTKNIKTYG